MNDQNPHSPRPSLGSEEGLELKKLVDSARGLPELRLERIRALREAIANGTYTIDDEAVAEKMIEHTLHWPRS